jgi:ABC-type branched-subunit amino acid transport system ATPase component
MPILKTENIEVKIGAANILNGISIEVNQAETVGIIGPNGCGKTTLFNTLSGFLSPVNGKISFLERDITNMPAYQRAKLGIGRVFQNFGIFRDMTVLENMTCAIEGRKNALASFFPWSKANKENKKMAMEYLSQIKLDSKAGQKAANLSGGQMRLLEIMRTLAAGAELFLLDEPTAGVSPKMKDDVVSIINKLKAMNKTILIIEHDINFIQKFCQRIIVLDGGKVMLDDTPEKVRNNKQLQEIYFGS